jgi:hypothetical protein
VHAQAPVRSPAAVAEAGVRLKAPPSGREQERLVGLEQRVDHGVAERVEPHHARRLRRGERLQVGVGPLAHRVERR